MVYEYDSDIMKDAYKDTPFHIKVGATVKTLSNDPEDSQVREGTLEAYCPKGRKAMINFNNGFAGTYDLVQLVSKDIGDHPIIFLDVDEVLTHRVWNLLERKFSTMISGEEPRERLRMKEYYWHMLDPIACFRIAYVCSMTGAKIVMNSSAVVRGDIEEWKILLSRFGVHPAFIVDALSGGGGHGREREVKQYVKDNNISSFIIVDDAGDKMYEDYMGTPHMIEVNGREGLRNSDLSKMMMYFTGKSY